MSSHTPNVNNRRTTKRRTFLSDPNDHHDVNLNRKDDDDRRRSCHEPLWRVLTGTSLPHFAVGFALRTALGITAVLYVLNQSHLLPRPVSSVVSKALFWPTLPITASRRIGSWVTRIDDTVVMGGAPLALLNYPQRLHDKYGIRGVVNFCEEYRGPIGQYKRLGIEELYLPTTDHFEPSLDDLMTALSFIKRHEVQGKRVYVHCRAGHGRSGAAVFAWMLLKDPTVDLRQLNAQFGTVRNVRSTLWKQPNIVALHQRLLGKGVLCGPGR